MLRQMGIVIHKQLCCIFSVILLLVSFPIMADHWRRIAPGIEYTDLSSNPLMLWSHIHVFRIDLKENQFELVLAKFLSHEHASIDEFAHHTKALITINGGFFDHNYKPLGLRVSRQEQYSPLKQISWWGIFYIKDNVPHISGLHHFKNVPSTDFAVQSGPRLIIHGKIPALKAGLAERTALGISENEKVIILVTENTPMSTTTLATFMQSPPLHCLEAINLDGGSSTQLNAQMGLFRINVHSFSNVSDAIIVKPRH